MKLLLYHEAISSNLCGFLALLSFIIVILLSSTINMYKPYTTFAQQQSLSLTNGTFSILNEKGSDLIYNKGNYTEAIKYFDRVLEIEFLRMLMLHSTKALLLTIWENIKKLSHLLRKPLCFQIRRYL